MTLLNYPYPNLIAHRGAGHHAPENTLAAFRYGAQHGYTMFECDVKLSKDKQLFLLHDDTLDRTTNGQGSPKQQAWADLSCLDAGRWHSSLFTGESLARLDNIMQFILHNRYQLDIELKANPGEEYETGKACVTLLEQHYPFTAQSHYPFLLSSFSPLALQAAFDHQIDIPRALLLHQWHDNTFDLLEQLDCRGLITNYRIISKSIVEQCHQQGRFVMVYTVNDAASVAQMYDYGVDSVITDNMKLMQSHC